jgi:small GTP-binding protein
MDINYDETVKIILLGSVSVGKTTFCNVLKKTEFNYNYHSTIGVDFHTIYYTKNKKYRIQIWDTAGQEKFRSLVSCYFKKTDVIIIMFDINEVNAYNDIMHWREFANTHANPHSPIILVGNKTDLMEKANMEKIRDFADINKLPLYNMSIKTNNNFDNFLNLIIDNLPHNIMDVKLEQIKENQKGCCMIQ